jgi:hypothetical protein
MAIESVGFWFVLVVVVALGGLVVLIGRRLSSRGSRIDASSRSGSKPPDLPAPQPNATAGLFISYRREDESNFAGRLFERLLRSVEKDRVFMDVDSIELGLDFKEVIDTWLEQCSVMLVVIGKRWLDCTGPDGRRRLDDPHDFVRIEVEGALARPGVRVIPVLVDGASLPGASDLPDSLKPLARRNGLAMSHAGFGSDFERLFLTLDRVLQVARRPRSHPY